MSQPINLNDTTPAALSNTQNLKWQADAPNSDPTVVRNISVAVPKMVASGASHQAGIVPDPGAVAGTSKFLREDATFAALPALVASGGSHAAGLAPDPGSTAGTTKFLREDATWAVPPGSGGGGGASGTLFTHFADAGSVGTGETDLYSDSVVGNTLSAPGVSIVASYGGTFVNSASTKQLKVYFGGTVIFDSGALTISAASYWDVEVTIIEESSTVVRCKVSVNITGASTGDFAKYTGITGLTLSNAQILKITGTAAGGAAANNDVLATIGEVLLVAGGLGAAGMYLTDGTNYYIGPTTFLCTLPVAGNYAWINQGTATEAAAGNALFLSDLTIGTIGNLRIRKKTIGTKTTLIAALIPYLATDGGANHNAIVGIGLRESATGKLLVIGAVTLMGALNAPRAEIDVFSYTNPTTFNATRAGFQVGSWPAVLFFKLVYNGTNVTVYWSTDGTNWIQLYTAAKTADFTTAPDEWFYFVNPQGNAACAATLLSWTES